MDLSASLPYLRLLIGRILGVVNSPPSGILPPQTSLLALPEFVPPGFNCGLEIFNDDRTSMEFVVSVLTIHTRGGALLPMQRETVAS